MNTNFRSGENGVALLIVLFLVSFLVIIVGANANALFGLKREIKLVDQQQKARWSQLRTNQLPQTAVDPNKK
jgi:type II secretory pathway component PulK